MMRADRLVALDRFADLTGDGGHRCVPCSVRIACRFRLIRDGDDAIPVLLPARQFPVDRLTHP
jgi:hypothetical protein